MQRSAPNNTWLAMDRFAALPLTEKIGLFGLYGFMFFAWESKARAAVAFAFVLIPCLLDRRFWLHLKSSKVAWVLAMLLLYILVRGLAAGVERPEHFNFHMEGGWHLMLLAGFIFVAWLLRADQRRLLLALSVALLGFWVGRMEQIPWSEALSGGGWWNRREGLGLSSNGFGLYAGTAVLGLALLAKRIWTSYIGDVWTTALAIFVWVVFLALSVQGLIMAQSRAAWLAVTAVGIILVLLNLRYRRRPNPLRSTIPIIALVCMTFLIGYANQSTIKQRFSTEVETAAQLLRGEFQDIEAVDEAGRGKSIGIRYHMLMFGIEHWQTSPWFGLGPGISKPLIDEHWTTFKSYSNLHNTYLELVLRLGLVGISLVLVMLALVVHGGWSAYRQRRIDRDLFFFLMAAIGMLLLTSFVSFRMPHADWRYYWFLIGGALHSFSLCKPTVTVRPGEVCDRSDRSAGGRSTG